MATPATPRPTDLTQLANAGVGKPVKKSTVFDTQCKDRPTLATYSDSSGDARAQRAKDHGTTNAGTLDAAIIEIVKSICR